MGQPKSDSEALRAALDDSTASQRNRHDAAIELALSQPGQPLHEVRTRVV